MGKSKNQSATTTDIEDANVSIKEEDTYCEKLKNANRIASPMASKKLTKKCYKLVKKGRSKLN